MWNDQISALSDRYRVIAYDARGHGRSANATGPYRLTDDLAALLRHLGTGPAVLVGVSMGAGLAVDTALEHPELVSALVATGGGNERAVLRGPVDPAGHDRLARRDGRRRPGRLDRGLPDGRLGPVPRPHGARPGNTATPASDGASHDEQAHGRRTQPRHPAEGHLAPHKGDQGPSAGHPRRRRLPRPRGNGRTPRHHGRQRPLGDHRRRRPLPEHGTPGHLQQALGGLPHLPVRHPLTRRDGTAPSAEGDGESPHTARYDGPAGPPPAPPEVRARPVRGAASWVGRE
ncbi:alpha/beta fold hydrolase [Nonomuraea salmonea]|uniref:alpha/beta fold hydrolase n=1 Tax=Nonomuraea salmonea TaxID=46181 RepID=UPI003CD0BED9